MRTASDILQPFILVYRVEHAQTILFTAGHNKMNTSQWLHETLLLQPILHLSTNEMLNIQVMCDLQLATNRQIDNA